MNKLKRLTALLLCFALTIISLQVIPVTDVSADDVSGIVSVNKTFNYTSVEDARNDGWSMTDNEYARLSVDEDGYVVYEQIAKKDYTVNGDYFKANTAADPIVKYHFPAGVVAVDETNNTKIINMDGKYTGKVQVDVQFEMNIKPEATYYLTDDGKKTGTPLVDSVTGKSIVSDAKNTTISVAAPYYALNPGADTKDIAYWRFYNNRAQLFNTSSASTSTIFIPGTTTTQVESNLTEGNTQTVTVIYDIPNNEITGSLTGDTDILKGSAIETGKNYIDNINLKGYQRMDVGSWFKFKGVKVTTLDPAFGTETTDMLSALGEKLNVQNVNAVTEPEFDLPQIDGVEWSTSDSDIISINGTKANVTRYDEDKSVTLTATFKTDGINYSKEYTMTVAKADNIIKYYANGELYDTDEIADGSLALDISAPLKEHYDFAGWYLEDNTKYDFSLPVFDNVTLYAHYELKTYNVEFWANGSLVETLTAKYNQTISGNIPNIPDKDGYTAVEWRIGDTEEKFDENTIITENTVVNAFYISGEVEKYNVTFISEGIQYGDIQQVYGGYTATMPKSPEKENYVFEYWTLKGEKYNFDTPVEADITLTAVFAPAPFEVNFYTDDSMSKLYEKGTGYYNKAYGTLPVITKAEYEFLGWKTEDGKDFTSATVITDNVNVYAVWESMFKVILNEDVTKYDDFNSGNVIFDPAQKGTTWVKSINGGYVVDCVNGNDTAANERETVIAAQIRVPEQVNEKYRTRLMNERLIGDYEIAITFDAKLTGAWGAASSIYGYFSVGSTTDGANITTIHMNRLRTSDVFAHNSASSATNTLLDQSGSNPTLSFPTAGADGVNRDVVIRTRYNTSTNESMISMDGDETIGKGPGSPAINFMNGFSFQLNKRNKPGDFLKIKNVSVTRYDFDNNNADYVELMNIMNSLPETLVEDPYNVTESFSVPINKNVFWTTSNSDVCTTKGVVTRWYDDMEVVLTATASVGNYMYSKEYVITVPGEKNINRTEIINETFEEESDLANWEFVNTTDEQIADYTVDENGIKISKITPADNINSKYESKQYFAFYDFYKKAYSDLYSTTYSKDLMGVYDVNIDYSAVSESNVPLNISVGYRNGNVFYSTGMIKIAKDKTTFSIYKTGETEVVTEVDLPEGSIVTIRIDNILKEVTMLVDGKLVSERNTFYQAMGNEQRINGIKVEMDVNNEIGDYALIKNITVTELIKNDVIGLEDVLEAADTLDVYDIVDNPDSVSGYINELTDAIGDYRVDWSSTSNQIDLETREVFHDEDDVQVILTAEIYDANAMYPIVVRKTFALTVRKALSDEELGKNNINKLGKITNQSYKDIRYDLNLPQADGVEWSSSNVNVIGNDGKINPDATITEPIAVVITATSNGVKKDYNLSVSPRTPVETFEFDNGISKISSDMIISYNYKNTSKEGSLDIVDDNGNIIVSMVSTANGFYFDYKNSDYCEYTDADSDVKIIVMPDVDKLAIYVNEKIVADYVGFKNSAEFVAEINTDLDVNNVTYKTDRYGILTANTDNFDYFGDVVKEYTDGNIDLPVEIITTGTVSWISDNESLISNNGTVTTPEIMTLVNLNFKITDTNNSNVFIERKFEIAVDCADDKNLLSGIEPKTTFGNPDYSPKNITDNEPDTIFEVIDSNMYDSEFVFELESQKTVNALFVLLSNESAEDYSILYSDDGITWNNSYSGNMSGKRAEYIEFNNITTSYIKLIFKKCKSSEIYVSEVKMFFNATEEELAQIDVDSVTIPKKPTGTSITIPDVGVNGTEFTWISSNPEIISVDGKIARPSEDTTVTLTLKAEVNGKDFTRTFDVYVTSKSSDGPTHVGGSGGGGGGTTVNVSPSPVVGTKNETIYSDDLPKAESIVDVAKYYDVNETDWYYSDVMTLNEKGIVSGDGTGYFYPTNNVTREQFVKMILEAIEVDVTGGEHSFTDVISGAWYEDYIATAVSNGIVNGIGDGKFGVGTNITRQDMAVLIERVLSYKNIEVAKAEVEPFADAAEVSDYALDAVANMKAIGLIKGYNNMYNPKDNLTRAEAATVIASLLKLLS